MREFENEIPKIDFDQSRCKFGAHQIKSIRVKYIITYVVSEFIANKLKTSLKTRYTKITMIVIMAIEEEKEIKSEGTRRSQRLFRDKRSCIPYASSISIHSTFHAAHNSFRVIYLVGQFIAQSRRYL